MNHILLVDGSNLLFQMFYGMPARILNRQGRPIHGTLGFVGALLKMIRWTQADHVAVVFDGECENGRTQLDQQYKANREDYSAMDPDLTPFSQLPDIYMALEQMGICYKETRDCEADDWIAGYARQLRPGWKMTVASQDSDFFQLISPQVQILRYRGQNSVIWDEACLAQKLDILPGQYADLKAMTGDGADNIRGARGIGPKTAAKLLKAFGSLEQILACKQQVSQPSVRRALEENQDRLRLNYLLIRLDGSEELPFTWEEMAYTPDQRSSAQILAQAGITP